MPRFFFHVRDGADLSVDCEGQILPSAEAARREAVNASREMVSERVLHGGAINGRRIEIADESGLVVDVVETKDVLMQQGRFRAYDDDVTTSAPAHRPPK